MKKKYGGTLNDIETMNKIKDDEFNGTKYKISLLY